MFKDSTAKSGVHNVENQLNLTAMEESSVSLRKRVRHLEEELEQMKVRMLIYMLRLTTSV